METKKSSNAFRIRVFLFHSYSYGIETIIKFIRSRSSLENHNEKRPKWEKCAPVFRPKRRKNPSRWGGTYLPTLYKGVTPRGIWDYLLTQPFSVYRDNFAAGWMNLSTVKAALHKEDVSLIALFMFAQIIHHDLTFQQALFFWVTTESGQARRWWWAKLAERELRVY